MHSRYEVIAFDCQGAKFIDQFKTEEECEKWAKDHALEVFSIKLTYTGL